MNFDPNEITPSGKTYAQVDAEEAEYVRSANAVLASMRTKSARWISYSASHRTFELVVCNPWGGVDSLILSFAACDYIAGPVSWPNQQLALVWHCDRSNRERPWEFMLQDEAVGFRLVARTFRWQRDVNSVEPGGNDSQNATS